MNEYRKQLISQVPRLLGLMNRNSLSESYGCFDRTYWQYKIIDTPSARCQEAVLTLALLYTQKGSVYYNNQIIKKWIDAGLDFWCKIQSKNGSFSEWYPNENSFVATAFSTAAITETLIILGNEKTNEDVLDAVKKAGNYLLTKKETRVQNQEAGAILAYQNLYLLTGDDKYKYAAETKIDFIACTQTNEGWFHEYGGADIGYLSLTIDYLAKYYLKSDNPLVIGIIEKAIEFISYFIHPNGTFGGEYGSRNTEFIIPSGFELMIGKAKGAETIAYAIRNALKGKTTITPESIDDRYLTYIGYSWLQAGQLNKRIKKKKQKYSKYFIKDFQEAKILVVSNNKLYGIIGYGKGGACKLFFKNGKTVYDSGILAIAHKILYSSYLSQDHESVLANNKLTITGKLAVVNDKPLTPLSNISLRLFQMSIGKNEKIGKAIKEKLRDRLISKQKITNNPFRRIIDLNKGTIHDFVNEKTIQITGSKYSFAYTPSSRYFQISELWRGRKTFSNEGRPRRSRNYT